MSIDVSMFQQAFFEEATELLNALEAHLLDLEQHKHDKEVLNTIFRCAHSIKGGAATFGLPAIAQFTHKVETLLDQVRSGQVPVTPELCSVLFLSLDQIRSLVAVAMGTDEQAPDDLALITKIELISKAQGEVVTDGDASPVLPTGSRRYRLILKPGQDVLKTGSDPCLMLNHLGQICEIESVVRDDSHIPRLEELDPEACYLSWEIIFSTEKSRDEIMETFEFIADESEIQLEELESCNPLEVPELEAVSPLDRAVRQDTLTLRVSSDKVDRLVDLVGELVIAQSMLNEAAALVELDLHPRLAGAIAAIERTSREIQERVMGIRLVQLKHAFARFPRMVHDLSATVGKKIELVTAGEETELDKTLIESLGDPLTHLIRNSIDHGLETPAERLASGKPEVGTLRIHSKYEGGNVIIEVSDDGRGLDREQILKKARDKGLVGKDDSLSDDAIDALIFQPGFSTAQSVTDLSGRGVGMDIVRKAIQAMNGSISLVSKSGVGTSFRIRLPLTMAILEGLSLSIGEETYILPLTSIVESLRPRPEDLTLVAGKHEIVRVRGEVLKLLRLYQAFDIPNAITNPCEGILVIVENESHKVAILVDALITQNQAVIKSLDANYRKVDGITGATILGDGRVALIIDVPGLLRGIHTDPGTVSQAA